jgi:ubiquinone/menaquinone biosynthesis C-methylase UbiE
MSNPTESFLQDFHNARPGLTAQVFADLPVREGELSWPSTYAALAAALPTDGSMHRVFDLACGDGYLLGLLAQRLGPSAALTGLDMSPGELAAARERLGERAVLLQGRAQALPLSDASQDAVSCHLALMLMHDLDTVMAQLHRVLRPGGQLLVLVGARQQAQSPALALWRTLLQAQTRRPDRQAVQFGDARLADDAALRTWWQKAGFTDLRVRVLQRQRQMTPAQWWDWFDTMYDLHLLPDTDHAGMRQRFEAALAPLLDAQGQVWHGEAFHLLQATRAQAS